MTQKFNSSDERDVGYGPAYVIDSNKPDFLVGRLLTILDATIIDRNQNKALKDIIRSEVYGVLQSDSTVWINGNLHNVIKDFTEWYETRGFPVSNVSESFTPNDNRQGEYELTFTKR